MDVKTALGQLDPANDEHWTSNGLPRVEAIGEILGRPVTRQEITDAGPAVTRGTPQRGDGTGEPPRGSTSGGEEGEESASSSPTPSAEEVLRMRPDEVIRSPKLTEIAFREIERQIGEVAARKLEVDRELDRLHAQADVLARIRTRQEKSDPNAAMSDIQRYLNRSNQERERRAERARQFLASGTSAKDVAAITATGAPIDRAMARPTGFGRARPSVPPSSGRSPQAG